jgi:hypothetical protein
MHTLSLLVSSRLVSSRLTVSISGRVHTLITVFISDVLITVFISTSSSRSHTVSQPLAQSGYVPTRSVSWISSISTRSRQTSPRHGRPLTTNHSHYVAMNAVDVSRERQRENAGRIRLQRGCWNARGMRAAKALDRPHPITAVTYQTPPPAARRRDSRCPYVVDLVDAQWSMRNGRCAIHSRQPALDIMAVRLASSRPSIHQADQA